MKNSIVYLWFISFGVKSKMLITIMPPQPACSNNLRIFVTGVCGWEVKKKQNYSYKGQTEKTY